MSVKMIATNTEQRITLASFLWHRIRQLGVRTIMGVPGDMNLELLDFIDEVEGLRWIGNANELNAAYAADGYCRASGIPGVIVTTMGVGELSAINGIAGAYTEHVKVIHVVGTTSTKIQARRAMIHHCLGPNPDHRVYEKISAHVRADHCWLDDIKTAPEEIARVLRTCYTKSLPVYIFVPMDFVNRRVPSSLLDEELDLVTKSSDDSLSDAVETVFRMLSDAKSPVTIVDALVSRFNATVAATQVLDDLQIPTFTTPMGKSTVDETKPYFCGVYNGQVSFPGVIQAVEERSDLVLDLGPLHSDSNTGGHSRKIKTGNYISVAPDHVVVGGTKYEQVFMGDFFRRLRHKLQESPLTTRSIPKIPSPPQPHDHAATHITQSWIWRRIGQIVQPGDILIGESGTAQFGLSDADFPSDLKYITQIYYGSIGYSVPACFGAALAQSESRKKGRTVLVVGDGSLQLTVQEIATMIRCGLRNVIIIVINNSGYTIERAIHGPEQEYNDISTYNHQLLLSAFGLPNGVQNSQKVDTRNGFDEVVNSTTYTNLDSIQLLEVMMDKMDAPWRLTMQIDLINKRNAAAKASEVEPVAD